MPAAGNTGGAGGAKNVARAQRKPKRAAPGPPSLPAYIPKKPGQIPRQAQRQVQLARALPKTAPGPPRPALGRLESPSAAQATSERKRAKRVELSAQRKRTGGDAPIIVRRREAVARAPRELAALEHTGQKLGVLVRPPKKKEGLLVKAPKRPSEGGLLGASLGAIKLADKVLSGESVISKGLTTAASGVGTALESAATGRYLKKPFKAVGLKWEEPQGPAKTVSKVIKHGGREAVDLPANFIPSFYNVGKESVRSYPALARGDLKEAGEHQVKAARMLADPIVETVKHPGKSFVEHPLGTAAIFAGGEGALGRAGGAALRKGVAGKAGRRVARTERANRTVPGTAAELQRAYDPDVIRKGVQVAGEKIAGKARAKRGGPTGRRMTGRDINHELDQDVRIGRNVTTLRDERAAVDVAHAVTPPHEVAGRRVSRLRKKPVSAAHTAAVQGLTNATKADVERLLNETKAAAAKLGGKKLRQNKQRQRELQRALDQWKPGTEAHIRQTQERLREQTAAEEADLIRVGALDASRADANRYSTAAVRHGLHDPETAATHVADAGKASAKAAGARRGAFRQRQSANAALREQTAKTRAAELGPRGKRTAGTERADRELVDHEKALQKAKEQEARDLAAARKELDDARHAAEMSTTKISPTPEVLTAKARVDKANRDLADLTRQVTGRERVSGRQEGRAQEKVAAHERGRRAQGRRLSEEADRRQAELAIHNRALATAEQAAKKGMGPQESVLADRVATLEGSLAKQRKAGVAGGRGNPDTIASLNHAKRQLKEARQHGTRPHTEAQLEAMRRRRDAVERRADAADEALTRHHAEAPRAGTEPRGPLAALERRGGEDLQLRQRALAARAEVENAIAEHARAQSRAKGVPPKEADRLRKAIAAHDNARLKFADPESLVHLRDNVDVAKAKAAYEHSKTGLSPAAAERQWKAIHAAEDATAAHTKAIAEHEAAHTYHRALKDAPYIDSKGVPHSVEDVRSHPAMSGQPEPSFMPHAYEAAHGAVPVNKVKVPNPVKQRSGLMVAEGTSPVGRGQLVTARVSRARMISAAENRAAVIDKWGYRGPNAGEHPTVYTTKGKAEADAAAAERVTGHEMTALADQLTDGYVLVPKRVTDRLARHEETTLHRDRLAQQLGRAWRSGVLGFSTKWLTGQAMEPAVRLAITHNFNPVKLARSYRLLSRTADELKATDPEAFARFETLYKRGGVSRSVKVNRDEALQDFLMHDAAGGLEAAVRKFAQKPGGRHLANLYGAWQRLWFHHLNGSIESLARRGLVGHELIKDPIIRDRKLALNFSQAAVDLAEGLRNTPAQNRVARGVDDAFGKYQGRSPKEQAMIEGYTPFIPWFLSSMNFLYRVLPRDHPILTALAASANQSSEEWRRKYGIYYDPNTSSGMGVAGTDKNLPLTRQGSIPVGKNLEDTVNPTHYTMFAGPTSFGDVGSFLVPALQDIMASSKGEDWRGYGLTGRDKPVNLDRILAATLTSAVTTLAPPAGMVAKLAGIHLPNQPDVPEGEAPPALAERAGLQFNPLAVKPGLKKGLAEKEQRRKAASKRANAKRRKKPGLAPVGGNPFAGQAKSNPFAGGGG